MTGRLVRKTSIPANEGKIAARAQFVTAEGVSSQVIDGERLGALAHRLELSATVQIDRARHRWSTR